MWSYGFKYDLLKTLSSIHVNTIKNGKGEFQNKSLAKNFPFCHSMQFGYNNFKRTLLLDFGPPQVKCRLLSYSIILNEFSAYFT